MSSLSKIIFAICFVFFGSNLRAQITNSEESAAWLASKIAISSGGTADQHMVYVRNLAKTLSQFSLKEQGEIFGESAPTGGIGGSPPPSDPLGLIDGESLSSADLLLGLLELLPLDGDALTAVLKRDPPLESADLDALLSATEKLAAECSFLVLLI
ncbi:hypothetical protein OAL00_02795 [Verrucomicrobiales bacterium]|nr:hypothetical protein [Verrucomicrobiales bacterium]